MCGLLSKLSDKDCFNYIVSFDFTSLVETFVETIDFGLFSNYTVYRKPAAKLSKQGRHSGGILCLIRNSLVPFVRKLNSDNDLFIFFLLDKALLGITKDVVYVCAHVMPQVSLYYNVFEVESGIELLEECWSDISLSLDDVYVILCGDLNGRTSNRFCYTSSRVHHARLWRMSQYLDVLRTRH